jgi:hypothetical protein
VLTGASARADFADRRRRALDALLHHFDLEEQRRVPPPGAPPIRLYTVLRLRRPQRR